tara:strand:- start:21410 stop:22498 length:1089 start_codon:yes stop_codon:yes gene_type:complete
MKTIIFGLGRMGTTIAYAMHTLGYKVHCADKMPNEYRLRGLVPNAKFTLLKKSKDIKDLILKVKPDVVISSLPYHQLWSVAKVCIDNNIRYCDLGGRVDVSEKINSYAKDKATKPVFTDLGLAPGWINIIAEHLISGLHKIDNVKMYVGGLPVLKNNPLNYLVTWSVDGLLNEYVDDCLILKNGKLVTVAGMSGLQTVNTQLDELEAFYTSGGASHTLNRMKKRGVKNCSYRTFRYPGHIKMVEFLTRKCKLEDNTMKRIFEVGCTGDDSDPDLVILRSEVTYGDMTRVYEKVVHSTSSFSAMQRATAYSLTTVASLMGAGRLDNRSIERRGYKDKLPMNLQYSDVPYSDFENILNGLLEAK